MGTVAGVTIGRMLARGVDLLPGEGLGLLLGDGVLGVGRMLAVGGSDMLELTKKPLKKCYYRFLNFEKCTCIVYLHLFRMFSGVCVCVYVFIGYLPLSWAGLFRDICLWSVDLA